MATRTYICTSAEAGITFLNHIDGNPALIKRLQLLLGIEFSSPIAKGKAVNTRLQESFINVETGQLVGPGSDFNGLEAWLNQN